MAACAPSERTQLSWRIEFACAEEASRAQLVTATISKNNCDAPASPLYEVQITRGGDSAADPGTLSPGPYAFSASAVDATGAEIARACVSVMLPSSKPVSVRLFGSPDCQSGDTDGSPWPSDEAADAGVEADVDSVSTADAGSETNAGTGTNTGSGTSTGSGANTGTGTDAPTTCGVTDTDQDTTPDCKDSCPMDRQKVLPGACGCGVSDVDTDKDGTPDCRDACPKDVRKLAAGVCGCGIADTDTDKDGTADCGDGCPTDARKLAAGVCGCGISDADGDKDGAADCNDGCPIDAAKTAPGTCGCGVAEGTCGLTVNDVLGSYERRPISNGWHEGRIEQTTKGLMWINKAGVEWTLIPDLANEQLLTTADCPYYTRSDGKAFRLVLDASGNVTGFWFTTDFYTSLQ